MGQEIVNPQETYFSLASLVDTVCIDLGLPTDKYFNRLLSWACFGYVQLKLDNDYQPVTEIMQVSDVNTVRIPASWVAVTKIGVIYGQYIKVLSVCDSLNAQERLPGQPQFSHSAPPGSLPNGIDVSNYGYGFLFSNYGGRTLWGVSGQLPARGFYKLVKRQNGEQELLLDAGFSGQQIYVEGIMLAINPCGATICHPYCADYVRKYLHHQYEKFLPLGQRTEAAIVRTGRELWDSEMVIKGRYSVDRATLLAITRKHYRLTPKS